MLLIRVTTARKGPPKFPTTGDSVQFSSVAQSCPTFCNPVNRSTPGLPVHHQLPESTQTHVHCVGDAIQPSHPLVVPFSFCPQSLPASGSFQISQLSASDGQSIGVSASASVPPVNTQDWSLGRTGWINPPKLCKIPVPFKKFQDPPLWAWIESLTWQQVTKADNKTAL